MNTLAAKVTQYFTYSVPIHLVVLSAYISPPSIITVPDTRYEARAIRVRFQFESLTR